MDKRVYIEPQIAILEFEVEGGFANSIEKWDEDWF